MNIKKLAQVDIKKISFTIISEIAVKVIGLVSGILVIRLLPIEEYAMYTLANTMLGTMIQFADSGISIGVLSMGGKSYQNKTKLGTIINTALELRRKFGVVSYVILAPIIYYLMVRNEASNLSAILICLSMIPIFYVQLSYSINQIPLKLHQDLMPLQKVNLGFNVSRLLLISFTLFLFPFASLAMLVAGIANYGANHQLVKSNIKYIDKNAPIDPEIRNEFLKITKRILPSAIYFSLNGQITIWLLSIFGSVKSVAEIGALTRLSMAFGVLTSLFSLIVIPRFARLPNEKSILIKHFLQIQVLLWLVAISIPMLIWLFPNQILWVLGSNYSGLSQELLVLGLVISLNFVIAGISGLNSSRAFILNPVVHIPFNIIVLTISIWLIRPTNTMNALWLDLARASVAPILMNIIFFYYLNKSLINVKK